jgi:hypothetical protein
VKYYAIVMDGDGPHPGVVHVYHKRRFAFTHATLYTNRREAEWDMQDGDRLIVLTTPTTPRTARRRAKR